MLIGRKRIAAGICQMFRRGIRNKLNESNLDDILKESLKPTTELSIITTKIKNQKIPDEEFKIETMNHDDRKESGGPTAEEVAKKIRAEKKEKEKTKKTKTYPAMLHYTDFEYYTDIEIAQTLRKAVIYSDNKFVILNKPYGLPVHGGDKSKQNIKCSLPYLSKMIYGPASNVTLQLCNRLDKMTTGVLICAADHEFAERVIEAFREQKVLKKYWSVAVGNPDPTEGIIDIPLIERRVPGGNNTKEHSRVTLRPYDRYNEDYSSVVRVPTNRAWPATTWYRVLDRNKRLTLIELQPLTAQKHQLRVHLAEALSCPMLGDHKYSHSDRLAPQQLPGIVFRKYNITSTKTRHIPLHLHLREVIVPDVFDIEKKRHLHVVSKYSSHFYHTLKLFRLRPGQPTEWHRFKKANWNPRQEEKRAEEENPLFIDPTQMEQEAPEEEETWETMTKNSFDIFTKQKSRAYYKD